MTLFLLFGRIRVSIEEAILFAVKQFLQDCRIQLEVPLA